jgi:para-aminobenzoate synthetase/4-amino-4-deoxychorismate lyase
VKKRSSDVPHQPFPTNVIDWVVRHRNTVLLETTLLDPSAHSFVFAYPKHIVEARSLEDVTAALELVESHRRDGFFAAGFLTYEAGFAFERRRFNVIDAPKPLLWFGIYDGAAIFSHSENRFVHLPEWIRQLLKESTTKIEPAGVFHPPELTSTISFQRYCTAIKSIQSFIRAGDTYQVNFTFPQTYRTRETRSSLYQRLRQTQPVSYSAIVTTNDFTLLSFSPELFFSQRGRYVRMKPMKGTRPRGRTLREDLISSQELSVSEKERAENLMIVDLLRNDLGRVAEAGSVKVKRFFDVERYETVFQATSTVEAKLRKGLLLPELVRAIFPSGSVTGAPKIRTVEIIHQLERYQRGIYTGAIGYVAPNGDAEFNVAIRTIEFPRRGKMFRLGIGSGITIDSNPQSEFEECLSKAKFVTQREESFSLVETMLLEGGRGIRNWKRHVNRLRDSAKYFGFRFSQSAIESELRQLRLKSKKSLIYCRLLLERNGEFQIQTQPWRPMAVSSTVGLATVRTDSRDRLLFHKTTARSLYDRELGAAKNRGLFDILFFNERGELTEGARSNVVLEFRGRLLTPDWSCGLLQGTYRAKLLDTGKIVESRLTLDDMKRAENIFICNAIRGFQKVRLIL